MYDDAALSALDWWSLAGVDTLVDERPRDWLAPPRRAAPEAPAAAPVETPLPDTLAGFAAWWMTPAAPLGEAARRVPPAGDPAAGPMLLIDCPDAEDAAAGRLLSGKAARLFEAMLAAIGRDRETIYLASLWAERAAATRPEAAAARHMADIARHHVALAAPPVLLMLGKGPVQALTGLDLPQARGRIHDVGGVPAVATFHPATLLGNAALKAAAWADLLLLIGTDR